MVNRTQSAAATTSLYSSNVGKGQKSPPRFSDDSTVDELIQIAHDNLHVMTPVATAALWTKISRQLSRRDGRNNNNHRGGRKDDDLLPARNVDIIFQHTIDRLGTYSTRELTQTILSLSKITAALQQQRSKRGEAGNKRILRELLLNNDMTPKEDIFRFFAAKAIDKLDKFDGRCLSNLAYAYALIRYVPEFYDGSNLFDHIAMQAVDTKGDFIAQGISNIVWAYATVNKPHDLLFEAMGDQVVAFKQLSDFIPQGISNMVWAYATVNKSHAVLFEAMGDQIVALKHLNEFKPQELSNTVWAFATAGINRPNLFEKVANHIVESDALNRFNSQNLSNILWAYAAAGINHPKLFEKVANHIVESDTMEQFKPQDLSNIVSAFAKAGVHRPRLFEKIANHIVQSNILDRFNSQNLSNTVWAYATAGINHPKLFVKVAKAAIQRKEEFNSQNAANLLWTYATMGIIDKQLFSSFESTAAKLVNSYNNQDLANIAWAYAVADIDSPVLFNGAFIKVCAEMKAGFESEALYQWHLWQTKEKCNPGLPEEFAGKCREAFLSRVPRPSKLQEDVVAQLSSIGLEPKEEVLMDSGYRIDAIVEVNGNNVGVEVDGPWHFIGNSRSLLGRTILKRRQVPAIDGIELVSVPYWEWDKLGKDQKKKQEYLRSFIQFRRTSAPPQDPSLSIVEEADIHDDEVEALDAAETLDCNTNSDEGEWITVPSRRR